MFKKFQMVYLSFLGSVYPPNCTSPFEGLLYVVCFLFYACGQPGGRNHLSARRP
jgi:hypothetical protein